MIKNIFLVSIAEGQGMVAAVGGNFADPQLGLVYTSGDGTNFSLESDSLSHVANSIVYASNVWVIVGEGYAAYTSSLSGGAAGPYLTQGAVDLNNGWYDTWLGTLNVNAWPWVYSSVGWFYAGNSGNSNSSSWFYFTHPQLQCWIFASENSAQWVYGQPVGQAEGWWFVDGDSTEGFNILFGPGGATVIIQDEF